MNRKKFIDFSCYCWMGFLIVFPASAKKSDFSIVMKNLKTDIVQYASPIPFDPITIPRPSPGWECTTVDYKMTASQESMSLLCCANKSKPLACSQADLTVFKGEKRCTTLRLKEGAKDGSDISMSFCGDLK
jgi:hypothetical protein